MHNSFINLYAASGTFNSSMYVYNMKYMLNIEKLSQVFQE